MRKKHGRMGTTSKRWCKWKQPVGWQKNAKERGIFGSSEMIDVLNVPGRFKVWMSLSFAREEDDRITATSIQSLQNKSVEQNKPGYEKETHAIL